MIFKTLAKWKLTWKCKRLIAEGKIMEGFTTKTIIDGGSPESISQNRQKLLMIQSNVAENYKLLEYLRK